MTMNETLVIAATMLSPLIAVQVTQYLERRRHTRDRKEKVFKTLMATRSSRVSIAHVEALNAIDIEFYGTDKRSKAVTRAWAAYIDNLNKVPGGDLMPVWIARNDQLFIELLQRMAEALDYDFDQTTLRNSAYSPVAHGNAEMDMLTIREGMAKVLKGEAALPISVRMGPTGAPVSGSTPPSANDEKAAS